METREKKLLDKLCEMYIKDTKSSDGMKFCGCRKDDCDQFYNLASCKACLINQIEGELEEKEKEFSENW